MIWSGLGHRIVWYIVISVLDDILGLLLQAVSQITPPRKLDNYNFVSYYSAFSMHCITKSNKVQVLGNK